MNNCQIQKLILIFLTFPNILVSPTVAIPFQQEITSTAIKNNIYKEKINLHLKNKTKKNLFTKLEDIKKK